MKSMGFELSMRQLFFLRALWSFRELGNMYTSYFNVIKFKTINGQLYFIFATDYIIWMKDIKKINVDVDFTYSVHKFTILLKNSGLKSTTIVHFFPEGISINESCAYSMKNFLQLF
jgi:hypothetical protein